MLTDLYRALTETLKLKRSLILWLSLLTPGGLLFLEVAAATQGQGNLITTGENYWLRLFEHTLTIWVILTLTLFITLQNALLGPLEHRHGTWKALHSQPQPGWELLVAKQAWGLGLVLLGTLALGLLTVLGGWLLARLMPDIQISGPIPLVAAGFILALHSGIVLASSSFVVSSATGIALTISGMILTGLTGTEFFPWTLPANALFCYYTAGNLLPYLLIGGLGWLVLSLLANWQLCHSVIV